MDACQTLVYNILDTVSMSRKLSLGPEL